MERARLLFVHPHPDDESIACGGAISRYVEEGAEVLVVTCTGGEEGENLAGIDLGGRSLPELRREEMAAAIEALGHPDHEFLGYRDSGMVDTPANQHERSFHRAPLGEAAARLAATIRRLRPHVVVSDDEQGGYGHPDHIKANQVTEEAVRMAADGEADVPGDPWTTPKRYVWTFARGRVMQIHDRMIEVGMVSPFGEPGISADELPFGTPDEEVTTVLDVSPWLERKREAMRAHRTQIGEDSFFLNMPDDVARQAFGTESFVLRQGEVIRPASGDHEDDLVAGVVPGGR